MGKQESCNKREIEESDKVPETEETCDPKAIVELMPVPLETRSSQHTSLVVPSRTVGYQTLVHEEHLLLTSPSPPLAGLAQTLAEWLVVLQGVAEERGHDLPPVTCRCSKAARINEELSELGRRLSDASAVVDRVGQVPSAQLQVLRSDQRRVAGLLRSEVSILVPCGQGGAEPRVVEQAKWLLAQQDIADTVEGVGRLVTNLLGVERCPTCAGAEGQAMEEEIDPEIMSMVASMCGVRGQKEGPSKVEVGPSKDVGRQVLERSRKRKQVRPVRNRSPSITSTICSPSSGTPTKRMRKVTSSGDGGGTDKEVPDADICLNLLERKKKLVKKDGLYKFVLWREALRDEKTKLVDF